MRVFVHEFLAGGGMIGGDFDGSPLDEGVAMLRAAIRDFSGLDGVEVFTIIDGRLTQKFAGLDNVTPISADYHKNFGDALDNCDAALIVAPETGGTLEELTAAVQHRGKLNLGSGVDAIRLTGGKHIFSLLMKNAEVAHPATYSASCFFQAGVVFDGPWVMKPADGAGSDDVRLFGADTRASCPPGGAYIAQEYVEGDPMSLCVVSGEAESAILSVNRQFIDKNGERLKYTGGSITAVAPDAELVEMVDKIKRAIPQLRGFWGLDYVLTGAGPVAIELNPRLTSSYNMLAEALEINPAELILAAAQSEPIEAPVKRKAVEFALPEASCR